MSNTRQRVGGGKASFTQRTMNFFRTYKRDLFFTCVAFMAIGTVARRELMVRGVVSPPQKIEAVPRVEREFGSKRQRSE
ncbi:uncharacterized protein TEOVI_000623800 [Trypanosoma equiperdum]|uniref:Uncharacterized protein n=4 Tax=Trypanozoon TaxID=39700 RepID=Q57UN1_TRYB2|nr:hypothetical protein, conserved [Trypanosoma brucei gambiense DAL972]XP_846024.1 hypothetical protein, conserved [Trypanosoma brucei brucei TREU927]AAX70688.1 hypothetical protein, conserved [Trypanosoma brucei]RHW71353.1 hypothetical protein DPX39_070050300 [Trypanosoma brucei equiperdum]SCU65763.1 hypothetical protein, conserved [Trypanosoma equiperdum]AAZ12465.1 hypothetical protein, conserved [Trypanosoma brucei brucei TREU927]CBH12527.1 hypothetical protein, conserved [Trypanosoma bru|eukprot:XP_011774807.1 hypothetical protein, conserved [Trypanosoma brucei gambiense DAL972]